MGERRYERLLAGLNLLAAFFLGGFMASHLELRFLVPALVLDVFAIAHVVSGARQLVTLARVTFDARPSLPCRESWRRCGWGESG
jgi:hypothetical protein